MRRRPDDRGAVATVFALLLGGGVLLGLMAMVIDVGQIYVERGELQSSADAAALAVARACGTNTTDCDTTSAVVGLAQRYADENSSDGVTHLEIVCGSADVLDPCPPPASNLTACLGRPPATGNWVEVRVSTELPGDRFVLPPSFAQAVMPEFDGVSVGACARASWTEPLNVNILKLAMSTCDYDAAVAAGLVPGPPYPLPPSPLAQTWLGSASPCDPADARGAVLTVAGINCEVLLPDDHVIGGHGLVDSRFPVGGDCEKRIDNAIRNREKLYLPVYDRIGGTADDPTFHVAFLAGVVITGFLDKTTPGGDSDSWLGGAAPSACSAADARCVPVLVVDRLELSELVGDAAVDLIG